MLPTGIGTVAGLIDHTLLDPGAASGDIDRLCVEAAENGFAAACVMPWHVARAAVRLPGTVAACTVVSFPHGLDETAVKAAAVRRAVALGAREVDVVIAWGALAEDARRVADDAAAAVAAARSERGDVVVKLIVEASELDGPGLEEACRIVAASGADFAKTSTGTRGGATPDMVARMRALLPADVAIKASGGIRSADAADALLRAGATRLGTSAGVPIARELEARAAV
jgi:deoxyribose-phosphate aldolase